MTSNAFWISFSRCLLALSILAQASFIVAFLSSLAGFDLFRHFRYQTSVQPTSHDSLKRWDAFQGDGLQLRHVFHHGAGQLGPRARRLDVTAERAAQAAADLNFGSFPIKTTSVKIEKPVKTQKHDYPTSLSSRWILEDMLGPDVTDKETVINFAYMSEDAYKPDPSDPEWLDIDLPYNNSLPFGWDDNGIRGHVFSDATNSTIVLSLKGTTVAVYEGNGTSGNDKDNDNLFGSCCCGQGGPYLWRKVCDCQTGTYTCNDKCLKEELKQPNRYYSATLELYDEVVQLYPKADVITAGHSLGGVLASLIGLQHGIPSVSFEAYPQALAARRLGLPVDELFGAGGMRKNTGGFHFGHTADPIYMGTCNSASSFCSIAGYAFETLCHTGKRCVYDVVKDWGWRQSTSTHRLRYAIDNVYSKYNKAAPCEDGAVDCVDCYLWNFENGTRTTTGISSTSTSSRTRTTTCETPGWWGCRDKTTAEATTTTSTTATSTRTCKTPGWFGCKDKTTTTTTTSSTETAATCTHYGWFGRCLDPATATTATPEAAYWRLCPTPTQTPS